MKTEEQMEKWRQARHYTPAQLETARAILDEVRSGIRLDRALRSHPMPDGTLVAKHILVAAYHELVDEGEWPEDPSFLARIRMKPVRTLSGVTTVTVLTKESPCPGHCIFCPSEDQMPKSYLSDEPGAARAFQNHFDPFDQVHSRILEYAAVGHPNDKIELLILGGTWSCYPRNYQEWFIRRCFHAMNADSMEPGSLPAPAPEPSPRDHTSINLADLQLAHAQNENANHRNVGLVIETRPDEINRDELVWLRRLGVTKVQMGAQSLDDRILAMNKRGHTSADTLEAMTLLRAAGFKIVLHWMPNLLGATPQSDREDFARLWSDGFAPDEIKIYPTQLLESAELYQYWQRGDYTPYSTETLVDLLADIKPLIPSYCRVNRIIRDIPSFHVVAGNKRTSLRQDVHREMQRRGTSCRCIRCREVRGQAIEPGQLTFSDMVYSPAISEEHFLSFNTSDDRLAGYLRLSFPRAGAPNLQIPELENAAIIREVHVFGQSLPVGRESSGAAQHSGLGTRLLEEAARVTREKGFSKMAVIAAVGTRSYYARRGFEQRELYMVKEW